MSKSGKPASGKALDAPQSPSVYDFLYCDTRRIGSFLAQFDDSGHLEKVVQKEAATVGSKRGYKIALGGGGTLAGTGAQGNAGFEISPEAGGSEASERVYDPLWANALTFLDYLDNANLLQRDAENSRIGQFIITSGSLTLFDHSFLKIAWQQPLLRKMLADGIAAEMEQPPAQQQTRADRRRQDRSVPKSKEPSQAEAVIDLISAMPHTIVASMSIKSASVWCNLSVNCLVGQSSDLLLKHGASIPGQWSMVGILDALPTQEQDFSNLASDFIKEYVQVGSLGGLGQMIYGFAPAIRRMLGRPDAAYGITPLLIFRKV